MGHHSKDLTRITQLAAVKSFITLTLIGHRDTVCYGVEIPGVEGKAGMVAFVGKRRDSNTSHLSLISWSVLLFSSSFIPATILTKLLIYSLFL
jgi:hypothetical protein